MKKSSEQSVEAKNSNIRVYIVIGIVVILVGFFFAYVHHEFQIEDYCQAQAMEMVKDTSCNPVPAPAGWNGTTTVCKQFSEQLTCEANHKFLGVF